MGVVCVYGRVWTRKLDKQYKQNILDSDFINKKTSNMVCAHCLVTGFVFIYKTNRMVDKGIKNTDY